MRIVFLLLALAMACAAGAAPKKLSPILSVGPDGHLVYDADTNGNRVTDFSTCGFAGGSRSIPDALARVVVSAVPGDETARIQKAIAYVAGLPADKVAGAYALSVEGSSTGTIIDASKAAA